MAQRLACVDPGFRLEVFTDAELQVQLLLAQPPLSCLCMHDGLDRNACMPLLTVPCTVKAHGSLHSICERPVRHMDAVTVAYVLISWHMWTFCHCRSPSC